MWVPVWVAVWVPVWVCVDVWCLTCSSIPLEVVVGRHASSCGLLHLMVLYHRVYRKDILFAVWFVNCSRE